MLRFKCPSCQKVVKVPDDAAGKKGLCPRCGKRLLVPAPGPIPVSNKTVLGQPLADVDRSFPLPQSGVESSKVAPIPGQVLVVCPSCHRTITLLPHETGLVIECARCNTRFTMRGHPRTELSSQSQMICERFDTNTVNEGIRQPELGTDSPRAETRAAESNIDDYQPPTHSGLGISSFLIAFMVGGLNLVMSVAVTSGIARSETRGDVMQSMFAGGMSLLCLNFLSVPICLLGFGMAFVAVVSDPHRNHFFTRFGMVGNGFVVVMVMLFWLLGVAAKH